MPLQRAITAASRAVKQRPVSAASLASAAEHLPTPLMILSGPSPTRIEYMNPALIGVAGAGGPKAGDEVTDLAPWYPGSDLDAGVSALLRTEERAVGCAHPPWSDPSGAPVRSLLYRLPVDPGGPPLVAVVQLERPAERDAGRELSKLREEHRLLDDRAYRQQRWLQAMAELAEVFQHETGTRLIQASADTLIRLLPAVDAGVAVYMGGELALGSTSRGLLGPSMVTVTAHAELTGVLRNRSPSWLPDPTSAAFGAAPGVRVLAAPVAVVGEALGVLLLVMEDESDLDEDLGRALSVVSAMIGFALLRDRLMEGARAPRTT